MSKKQENEFRDNFIDVMRNAGIWIERVEKAKGMKDGFPDTVSLFQGQPFFIELKVGEEKDDKIKCKEVRPSQYSWHRKFLAQGGKAFILCGVKSEWSGKWAAYPFTINRASEYVSGIDPRGPFCWWLDEHMPVHLSRYAINGVNWAAEALQ